MAYQNIPIFVALWENSGYTGRRLILTEDTPNLRIYDFDNRASSIGIHPGPNYIPGKKYEVSFFDSRGYEGGKLVLTGPDGYANLDRPYHFEDVISSVKFSPDNNIYSPGTPIPVVVELYEDPNFRGRKLIVVENIENLHTYAAFGDIVSSVKVFPGPNFSEGRRVRLFSEIGGGGSSLPLSPGSYPDIQLSHNFGDICSSIYVNT